MTLLSRVLLLRIGVGMCVSVVPARALLAQDRSRLEATLGFGAGSGTIMCSACTHSGNMGGATYTLQLTSSPQPHVRVGATLDYWAHARDTWERDIWSLSVIGLYYPGTLRRGFFIGGGPSYSMMWASLTDSTALQRHGWGIVTEMGFELRPQVTLSLTPYVQYAYAHVGDIYYPKGSGNLWARGWRHEVVSIGLAVTYHAH